MKKSRFTKIALAVSCVMLSVVVIATSFAFVRFNKTKIDVETSTTIATEQDAEATTTETTTGESTTVVSETESEIISDEEKTSVTAEAETTSKTLADKPSASSKVDITSAPIKNTSASTGSSSSKNSNSSCSHSWSEYQWGTWGATDSTYVDKRRACSKCGKTESWENCNHAFGSWYDVRLGCQERECSKCGWSEERDADNAKAFMGTKSEYLELLGYINEARREAGYPELIYKSEWQAGADQRAIDLTQKFSHTRPDGRRASTAYSDLGYDVWGFAECCHFGSYTAKECFNSFKTSPEHWKILTTSNNPKIVISRCNNYWVVNIVD